MAKSEKNPLTTFWTKYFPYWPVFACLLAISTLGAWLFMRYKIPVYETTATILIKDEKKGNNDSKMMESLDVLSSKKIIENEMEVIRSRTLMSDVVKKLHLYASVKAVKNKKSAEETAVIPIEVRVMSPDSLAEVKDVPFQYINGKDYITMNGQSYLLNKWVTTPFGTLYFRKKSNYADGNTQFAFTLTQVKKVTKGFTTRLEISSPSKLSSVINIKLKDPDPELSEKVLNELIYAYNRASLEDKNSLAYNTLSVVDARLEVLTKELDSIEQKIESYKSATGSIDISQQGKLYLQSVSDNDQKLTEVDMELSGLEQVGSYVQSNSGRGSIVPSTVGVKDPVLVDLVDKLYTKELEYEQLKKTTAENNPILVSLADQIKKLKPSVIENIQGRKKALQAGRRNLSSAIGSYSSALQAIPKKEKELIEISRDLNTKKNIYTFLLQKREEASLSNASTVADSRVVDKAESSIKPVSPNKLVAYPVAFILAMALGIGFLVTREVFNRTILFRQEIEEATSIPIIGEIAYEKMDDAIVIGTGKSNLPAEQFRKLRASLPYLRLTGTKKKILVTSTIPGEGKSFVAANFALSLAITGKKVVLVEFDLANPTLGDKLKQYQEIGVADYLLGKADPEDIIKRTVRNENLFFISAGTLPKNPSEVIMSSKVGDLLKYLEGVFDYVVLDSAPAGPSSDAYTLSPQCDATFYVIRHKYTPKLLVERLDDNNKINNLKNIAIIFNGVGPRGFSKEAYGYGYGYGYAHSYYEQKKPSKIAQMFSKR
jgi:tyrosine-protein kinase Etk/Wzc